MDVTLPMAAPRPRSTREFVGQLRALPLFYRVLLGNCLVVVLGAGMGTFLTVQFARQEPSSSPLWLVGSFMLVGTGLSLLVNYVVLKAAFSPLEGIERTVLEVRRGNLGARAPIDAGRDPLLQTFTATLNAMLDTLERDRQQLQALSLQVIDAQEAERKRIARELHDETAQTLTSLLVRLRILERAGDPAQVRTSTAELRELTLRALEEVRNMARELRPTTLDDLGLVAAAQSYTERCAELLGFAVSFRAGSFTQRLAPHVELVLYRVIQEALTNVARHANARHVEVWLTQENGRAVATIRDDGVGFDVEGVLASKERGLGLFGMQERMALVGGRLQLSAWPNRGALVRAEVPLDELSVLSSEVAVGAALPATPSGLSPRLLAADS
ncbi:MAG TPA: sensor histidine kinase [Chloroflexota bacterium]|nr:sensor histidine kinase [Chloroflexota bacterium]